MTIADARDLVQEPPAQIAETTHALLPSALDDVTTFREWETDYYETEALRHYDAAVAHMLAYLGASPGAVILDAGCGTGVHAIRAARAGFDVHGIDISLPALELAARFASEAGLRARVTFERASLTALPFEDEQFAAAFSWGVLAHIEDVDRALHELVRILRRKGRLALQVTNHRAWDHRIEDAARAVLRRPRSLQKSKWGIGWWSENSAGKLWTWRLDVNSVIRRMADLGCRLIHRGPSEFTEMQRHARGVLRIALRRLNDLWFVGRLPARPACTNLLVFEKLAG